MMQDVVGGAARLLAGRQIRSVRVNELMAVPCLRADGALYLFQVGAVPGREIVQRAHTLSKPQQRFDQMRPDEAGPTGDQPAGPVARQLGDDRCCKLHTHRAIGAIP